jgi:antitoxin (DNA-binding transcriptional repressor) of toxin-antitoxin stability system
MRKPSYLNLSKRLSAGQEVFIARKGIPIAKIVPVKKAKLKFRFLKGQIPEIPDSVLFAMSDEEAA